MNTVVSFILAKLLKQKGFNLKVINFYNYKKLSLISDKNRQVDGLVNYNPLNWNSVKTHYTSAPTIAEVVMWLCEKHRIWIEVIVESPNYFGYSVCNIKNNTSQDGDYVSYNSPTEAYEAAIEYALNNWI